MEKVESMVPSINVLKSSDLVMPEDVTFLKEHSGKFEKRFRTRSLFRSKTEMEAGVLNDDEHPTPDSKYWQAIGEQNVHITELISLDFESKKHQADMELLLVEIEELEEVQASCEKDIEKRKLEIQIRKKKVEYEQMRFGVTQMTKTAQERMREIKTWEPIIENLERQLKYGDEEFGLHHPERYHLRYARRLDRLSVISDDAKENVVSHSRSFTNYFQKDQTQPQLTNQVNIPPGIPESCQVDYASKGEMENVDPIAKRYFDRKVRTLRVVAPHRKQGDKSVTNFNAMQPPAGFNCELMEPYGYTVADARNYAVQQAIKDGYDYIFFVDDDTLIPRNALVTLIKHKADIVGGMYYRKYFPLETVGMHENEEGQPCSIDNYEIGDIIHNTLVLPSGCTLIKVDTLKKIGFPWYKTVTVAGRPTLTEDTYLCQKMKDIGVDVITDTGVQCIHIGIHEGILYGHPDIVDAKGNVIRPEYRNYFAV